MQQVLDLHIHSKYSRACSPQLTLANIEATCRLKGVDIIGTGDFTYPAWFRAIKNELSEIESSGLYRLKAAPDDRIKFILSTEVALIYKDPSTSSGQVASKVRRIHLIVHAPNLKAVEELNNYLDKRYNIRSDGRPILGMTAPELIRLCLAIHPQFLVYPAHIWTPWFSVFGSKSGFDSFEACFHEQTPNVYAYETGLSSDPEMNWRVSELDNYTLLSNSDAHSLPNIGREANVMELAELSYQELYRIIKNQDQTKLKYSIEFYPEEGMYHFDGHRACGISYSPVESLQQHNLCPVCHKPLVIGVLSRVEELADRPIGFKSKKSSDFKKLIELDKIIAEALNIKSRNSKSVQREYNNLLNGLGSELDILLNKSLDEIAQVASTKVVEGIKRVREGRLNIKPGFDGQYGEIKIFS